MTFTRQQNNIVLLSLHDGVRYGFRTAFHDASTARVQHARQNVIDDGARLFRTRVVIGDNRNIRELFRNSPHQRTFTFITIAAAAKHAPEFTGAVQTRRFQRFFQRIRRVGIIHHDGRLARGTKHFHTATNRLQTRGSFKQFSHRITQRQQRRQRQQQVADVKRPHQAAFDFAFPPGGGKADRRPAVVIVNLNCFQPATMAVRINMISHRHRNRVRQRCQPAATDVVVGVDDGLSVMVRGVKQPFCSFVMLHITMIIEMIAAQVCEHRGGKLESRYAMLHQTV